MYKDMYIKINKGLTVKFEKKNGNKSDYFRSSDYCYLIYYIGILFIN